MKVLDFGLAKAMETAPAASNLTHSPTLSMMATQAGVILGTAAYMSPEQAKGFPADQRSDVFSFGSVLYEMLTGRQPFKGDTAPDVLASVLVREADLDLLPPNLNPRIPELLRRCLEKNPKKRWQAVGDLRAEIEAIAAAPRSRPRPRMLSAPTQPLWKRAIPVVGRGHRRWRALQHRHVVLQTVNDSAAAITRFAFTLGEGQQLTNANRQVIAISPDGTKMAYAANSRLYLRSMSELEARPIPGTEDTQKPIRVEPRLFAGWRIHRVLVGSRSDTQADRGHRRRGGDHLPGHESFRHDLGHGRHRVRADGGDHAGLRAMAASRNGSSTPQVTE